MFLRKTSRTRRLTRFRSTARLMCFLGVLIPRRVHVTSGPTDSFGLHCTRTTFPLKFRPNRPTRLKSVCDLMRSRGRNTSPSIGSTCARMVVFEVAAMRFGGSVHRSRVAVVVARIACPRRRRYVRARRETRASSFPSYRGSAPTERNCFFRHGEFPTEPNSRAGASIDESRGNARGGSGAGAATRRRRPRGRQTESGTWKAKERDKKSASANAPLVFVFSRSPCAGPPRTTRGAPRRVRSAPSSAETRAKKPRTPRTSRLQRRLRKRPPRPRGFRRRARTRRRRATQTPRWRSLGGGWMPRTRRASGRRRRRDGGATREPRRRFARDTSSARWTRLATRGREKTPWRAARARAPMRRRRARGCSFRGFRRAVATRPAPRSTPGDASWWACWNATDDRTSAARPLVAMRASGSAESDVKPSTCANAAGQSSRSRLGIDETDPRWTRQRLPRNTKELHLAEDTHTTPRDDSRLRVH